MFELPWIGFTTNAPQTLPRILNGCPQKGNPEVNPCLVTVTSIEPVKRSDGNVLIRLEHLCTPGVKCDGFDMPEDFDFRYFFGSRRVNNVTEYNLIGNYPINDRERLVWNTQGGTEFTETVISGDFVVTIEPTDLKTFVVDLE